MKFCPYRKRIVFRDKYEHPVWASSDREAIKDEEFLPCLTKSCMAYKDNNCLMIKRKEYYEE